MKHHLGLYTAGRHGSWSDCSCGWASIYVYTTSTGAHLAFGYHLIERPETELYRKRRG